MQCDRCPSPPMSFFAAIREMLNSRASEPTFARVTFCLVGVAVPSDLIRDPRTTPFNVGRRIVLEDFKLEDLASLHIGLPNLPASKCFSIFKRIHFWTSGQPYLTLRLCKELVKLPEAALHQRPRKLIDTLVKRLFLSSHCRDSDPNLAYTQHRILNLPTDIPGLLKTYLTVWRGQRLTYYPSDSTAEMLSLGGLVSVRKNRLVIRNRIYHRVFNASWVFSNLPAAEERRQRAEYRRGILYGGSTVALLGAVVIGLLLINLAARQRIYAAERMSASYARNAYRLAYDAEFQLIQTRMDQIGKVRADAVLRDTYPAPGQRDQRGFEWYYLHHVADQQESIVRGGSTRIIEMHHSADGKLLAGIGGADVTLWLNATNKPVFHITAEHGHQFNSGSISPDSRILAVPGKSCRFELWDIGRRALLKRLGPPLRSPDVLNAVLFMPDGHSLLCAGSQGRIERWSLTGQLIQTYSDPSMVGTRGIWNIDVSGDKQLIAAACDDGSVRIWNCKTGEQTHTLPIHVGYSYAVKFSRDGSMLISGGCDGVTSVYQTSQWKQICRWPVHYTYIYAVEFSPDMRYAACASWDNTATLWDIQHRQLVRTIRSLRPLWSLTFSPDGSSLALGDDRGNVRKYNLNAAVGSHVLYGLTGIPTLLNTTSDGTILTAADNTGHIKVWSVAAEEEIFSAHYRPSSDAVAVSGDGKKLVLVTPAGWTVFDSLLGQPLLSIKQNLAPDIRCALSYDGTRMAIISGNRCQYINSATGQRVSQYSVPMGLSSWQCAPMAYALPMAGLASRYPSSRRQMGA
jgi:WD40 repeat protein